MKSLSRIIAIVLLSGFLLSCNNKTDEKIDKLTKIIAGIERNTANGEPAYKLYSTRNIWSFLKLDTRNGKLSIVQFSVDSRDKQFEYVLSDKPLCESSVPGRFVLHPTENIYNFIMLDQVASQTYQVQWSFDEDKRMVIPIN